MIALPSVGCTATREGMTSAQHSTVRGTLLGLWALYAARVFHHGDCIGGDAECAALAHEQGLWVIGHPPIKSELRAFYPSDEERLPKSYLARDRAIVEQVDVLIACPAQEAEQSRGGTWYTIRYARSLGRHMLVIGPDGRYIEARGHFSAVVSAG